MNKITTYREAPLEHKKEQNFIG